MPAKLTVLIPCKDERRNIRPCIESVRTIADEILIADSGSTDGTLDIVRQIGGCRTIEREYVNSADFKNWAIPQARHEWVLLVDADERVTEPLAEEIRQVLAAPPDNIDGYWVDRRNHYLGYPIRRCGWSPDSVLRLFRRDASRYRARFVHAEIDLAARRVGHFRHPLLHYTTWDTDQYVEKLNRYAGWGARNFTLERREPGTLSLLLSAPLRFVQLYFLRLGFLDGIPGFQVCMFAAFYSFMKKAKLWEMQHGRRQPDPEAELEAGATIPISSGGRSAAEPAPGDDQARRHSA